MIAWIVDSHSVATSTRRPGNPYGIHMSAWIQPIIAAANTAGQITGTLKSEGHTARSRVTSHRIARAAVP